MTTTVRAVIMLLVLVGGPAAWMYYGPLPDSAQRVVNRFVASAKQAVEWDKHFGGGQKVNRSKQELPNAAAHEANVPGPRLDHEQTPQLGTGGNAETLAGRLEPLLARLRALGVAEYALEPWGSDGRMFRFRCDMPLAPGGKAMEQFEAVAADPQSPIEKVVADVTCWQAERLASR